MPRRPPTAKLLLALALALASALPAIAEEASVPPYRPGEGPAESAAGSEPAGAPVAGAAEAAEKQTTAEDGAKGGAESAPKGGADLTELQKSALSIELSTAGYYELVVKARELGLSDSGGADELRARLFDYYGIKAPEAVKGGRTVRIERAASAGFAKVDEEEGGIVRASGGVVLTLIEEKGDVHWIRADSIVYNRDRSTLTARGSVRYERKSATGTEIFTGDALSADLNDWSGVFLDGKVRSGSAGASASGAAASGTAASGNSSSGTTDAAGAKAAAGERGIVVQADTILRRSSNVMVLQNGVISACDEDDPHYAIRAKRVWLLGDKEWAMSNAVFSLGNVPILWVPFFYYPGDEIVFHPVIGYRSREGRFLQTTTYLVGAKPPKTSTTTFVSYKDSGTSSPTEVHGLFLRRVNGTPPEDKGTLKVMADAYSGLGLFTGLSGSFPKMGILGKTSLYLGIGRSRSLFPQESLIYSPYVEEGDYGSVWNSSDFLGISMPVRFALDLSTTLSAGGLTTNISLPIYSDPYFEQDFTDRSEDMDWFKLFRSSTDDDDSSDISTRSQLSPKIETTFSLKPDAFGQYLSSIEVTRFTTSAILNSKSSTAESLNEDSLLYNYDPNRTFFYPYTFRPIDASVTLKGTLYSSALVATAKGATPAGKDAASADKDVKDKKDAAPTGKGGAPTDKDAKGPGDSKESHAPSEEKGSSTASLDEMRNPWMDPAAPEGEKPAADGKPDDEKPVESAGPDGKAGAEGEKPAAESTEKEETDGFRLPARAPDIKADKEEGWSQTVGWTLTPSYYYEDSYLSDEVIGPEDVNYGRLYTLSSYKLAASIDGSSTYGDYLSSSLSMTYGDQKQTRPYLDESDEDDVESYRLADKTYRSRTFTQNSKLTLRPLADYWLWSGSNVSWSMGSTLYSYKYDTTETEFTELYMSWDPKTITSHDLSTVLEIRPNNLKQSLSLTASLPPVLEAYSGKVSFDAGIGSIYTQTRRYRPAEHAAFLWDTLTSGVSLGLAPWPVLTDTYVHSLEDEEPQSNVASLAWGPASFSLSSTQTQSYKPVSGVGWQAYGDKEFTFSSVTAALNPQLKGDESSKGGPAWSLGLGLSLTQSLVRFTESSLGINLNASYKVNDTLNFTLSSQSLNSSAWRYYPQAFKSDLAEINRTPEDYAVNPFTDLWNSLSIWDKDSRRESLIKLKSLSLKASQDLHDWTLSAEVSTKPLYDATDRTYSLDTTFSILLAWKDIPDIKTTITKETDEPITY
jgi:hypothetical protein